MLFHAHIVFCWFVINLGVPAKGAFKPARCLGDNFHPNGGNVD